MTAKRMTFDLSSLLFFVYRGWYGEGVTIQGLLGLRFISYIVIYYMRCVCVPSGHVKYSINSNTRIVLLGRTRENGPVGGSYILCYYYAIYAYMVLRVHMWYLVFCSVKTESRF